MESQRVFLLERDRVEARAAASLIEQCGHVVAEVAHSLEDAMQVQQAAIDFALLELNLVDGTDATPVAELLSAAGIPYAFIVRSGDRTDPLLFPGAGFLRKPLTAAAIEAVVELGPLETRPSPADADEAQRRAEIKLIKSKLQDPAMRAGPGPDRS
jgi:CheY-like chemotaxis protein